MIPPKSSRAGLRASHVLRSHPRVSSGRSQKRNLWWCSDTRDARKRKLALLKAQFSDQNARVKELERQINREISSWHSGRRGWSYHNGFYNDGSVEQSCKDNTRVEEAKDNSLPYEMSKRERLWKERLRAFERRLERDPYETLFGAQNDMLKGLGWKPSRWMDWINEELSSSKPSQPEANTEYPKKVHVAAEPVVEPTASPREKEDTVRSTNTDLEYDPISGRMVPKPTFPVCSEHATNQLLNSSSKAAATTLGKLHDSSKLNLTAESIQEADTPYTSKNATNTTSSSSQPQSRNSRADKEDRWGAFAQSDRINARPQLPPDDIDLLRTSDVRARMGRYREGRMGTRAEEEARRARLEEDYQKLSDRNEARYYDGMREHQARQAAAPPTRHVEDFETAQFTPRVEAQKRGGPRLQTSLDRMGVENGEKFAKRRTGRLENDTVQKQITEDDGYSRAPIGLQESYKRELPRGQRLEAELKEPQRIAATEDGYSRKPIGLETSYAREVKEGRRLEDDLNETKPTQPIDDGYTRSPMGLQTSYSKEIANGVKLEQELKEAQSPPVPEDGYSREPTGLQTSFKRELEAGKMLEDDVKEPTVVQPIDDGYSQQPTGLQTSYRNEVASGKRLEDDIKLRDERSSGTITLSNYTQDLKRELAEVEREDKSLKELRDLIVKTPQPSKSVMNFNANSKAVEEERLRYLRKKLTASKKLVSLVERSKIPLQLTPVESHKAQPAAEEEEEPQLSDFALEEVESSQPISKTESSPVISNIYDKYFGPKATVASSATAPKASLEEEVKDRIDERVHKYCQEYEKNSGSDMYKFTAGKDNLEAELAAQNKPAFLIEDPKPVDVEPPTPAALKVCEPMQPNQVKASESIAPPATPSDVSATPADYLILALDPSTDKMICSTTRNTPTSVETPETLSTALSKLAQPAKYLPYLTGKDFSIVGAGENLLVLKLAETTSVASKPEPSNKQAVEPQENPTKSATEAPKQSTRRRVNPVDGTTTAPLRSVTGNFASPTGFVNHDAIDEPSSAPSPPLSSAVTQKSSPSVVTAIHDSALITPGLTNREALERKLDERFARLVEGRQRERVKEWAEELDNQEVTGSRSSHGGEGKGREGQGWKTVGIITGTAGMCYLTGVVCELWRIY